ncbi:MAG: Gfo/Idh/MocA family oxidoreductase [Bdellovibrionaceae bacterium]|nr:Gfo/Idh/MocA family oxidoreductase [Pseudobdellovibrionaceae bacterium]
MILKKRRVGIVGGGFGLAVLLPAFRSISDCDVVGLVASSEMKTKAIAEKNSLSSVFRDWNDMLDNGNLDILAIATPPELQVSIIKKAFKKNIAVFAEKPLGLRFEDAKSLLKQYKEVSPRNFAFDVEFMEIPKWKQTKALLVQGQIGAIKRIFVNWNLMTYANLNHLSNWKTSTELGGGALSAFGTHVFYYLEEFVGSIEKVNVLLSRDFNDQRETDTFLQINCVFKSGAEGHVVIHTNKLGGPEHRIEFVGEKGQILLLNTTSDYMRGFKVYSCEASKDSSYSEIPGQEESQSEFSDGRIDCVRSLVARWMTSIANSTSSTFNPGMQQAFRNQYLINLAMKSHQTQQWVDVVENINE